MTRQPLMEVLLRHSDEFHPVLPFNSELEKLLSFDFTKNNNEIFDELINDTQKFTNYINEKLKGAAAKFGIGGYNEHRELYKRSEVFSAQPPLTPPREKGAQPSHLEGTEKNVGASNREGAEPRRLH